MLTQLPPGGMHRPARAVGRAVVLDEAAWLYKPPARSAEDNRALLNWLSTRVNETGKRCSPDHLYERALVERGLRVARRLGLTVQPGVYLPRPEQPQKRRTRKAA